MNTTLRFISIGLLVLGCAGSHAAPTIVSTVPPTTGNGPIQFTFSEAMNTMVTSVMFVDQTTSAMVITTPSWNGSTVLNCTPMMGTWPAGHTIGWTAYGMSLLGSQLGGTTTGSFTGPAGVSTGCDPIAPLLSLTVAKGGVYSQTSAGQPGAPSFCFVACATLPCPRDATNVTVTRASVTRNLALTPLPGHLNFTDCPQGAPPDITYPDGTFAFTIKSVTSNQTVNVDFPGMTTPSTPHVANYAAAQAINPAQPFTLTWDTFTGGTASDLIYVEIYGGAFKTPALGEANPLPGTATSVVIPANTLQPNHSYSGCITFYRYVIVTNGTSHLSLAYRSTTTEFNLATTGVPVYHPDLTNFGWAGSAFRFDVPCSVGQALTAVWSTNAALPLASWQLLSFTNSTTTNVRFTDPAAGTRPRAFYRVRTGS